MEAHPHAFKKAAWDGGFFQYNASDDSGPILAKTIGTKSGHYCPSISLEMKYRSSAWPKRQAFSRKNAFNACAFTGFPR
ncbi:hypothetical protein AAGS40_14740 [Paraburkholderia sp. PREW-6R]|uniref:hypothetical protein n=1 Tax=Paraburkholderia sp. PREW-6R TaxID=3141544 RepID=UPI0031F4CE6C